MDEIHVNDKADLSSKQMNDMIFDAFLFQKKRAQKEFNGKLQDEDLKKFCILDDEAKEILDKATLRYNLSQRGVNKTLKVARSCADLAKSEIILRNHVLEALSFRMRG